jgi:Armadillo/beta-catenin-like repeat
MPTAGLGQADPNTPMRNSSNAAAVAASATDLENLPAMVNAAAVTAANFENLPALDKVVMDHDPSAQLELLACLRRLLSIEDIQPILHQVIDSGVVPHLVEILNRVDKPRLQFQAAWALG